MATLGEVIGDIEWGSVGEWVSGLGTLLAVVVALSSALRAERQRREERLAAVYAWFTVSPAGRAVLHLRNATDIPVYQWELAIAWDAPDGSPVESRTGSAQYGILPPGQHDFAMGSADRLPANDADVRVTLRFRDAQGRRLSRTPTGYLQVDNN
jgi:hypothetical protein